MPHQCDSLIWLGHMPTAAADKILRIETRKQGQKQ
jgi:hypothetical protein